MNCHETRRYIEREITMEGSALDVMRYRGGYAGTLQTKTMAILLSRLDTQARHTPLALRRSDIADSRHLCSSLPHRPS